MPIDYQKRGLRLGYLIRCKYHDPDGHSRALRLSGPAPRVGTGHTAPDPDDGAQWPTMRYWRAGAFNVSMIEDLGKLSEHIAPPGQFAVTVPLSYPVDPDSETPDDSGDGDLRMAALYGRWRSRDLSVWIVDLDSGDAEERFRGFVDRPPSIKPQSFSLIAREYIALLAEAWPTVQYPIDDSAWTETRASGQVDALYYPGTYDINPDHREMGVGGIIGKGVTTTAYEAIWREILPYGQRGIPLAGTRYWAHVSAQPNVFVHELAVQVIGLAGGTILKIPPTITFLNEEYAAGPLGTNVTFGTSAGISFPFVQGYRVFARISGPEIGQPTSSPVGNGAKTEYIEGIGLSVRARIEDILEDFIETPGPLSLGQDVFGTGALADFDAQRPINVQEWERMQCAVPLNLTKNPPTVRDVLTDLFKTAPADFAQRFDPTTGERRWYPLWRRPNPVQFTADYQIRPSDLVGSSPVSGRVLSDPSGEYLNRLELTSAQIYGEPQAAASGDPVDDLSPEDSRTQLGNDLIEQGASDGGGIISKADSYSIWNHEKSATGDGLQTAAQVITAQFAQRQTYSETDLGSPWYRLQLGDTIQYRIHGLPAEVGQIRRLERDLESQTINVTAIHATFYDTSQTGGDGDEGGD